MMGFVLLSRTGLKGIVIASTPGTADTPRAHITNMATMGTMASCFSPAPISKGVSAQG